MTSVKLLETQVGTPPAVPVPKGKRGLPEDLLREASRRLGIVCLVAAGLWCVELLLLHLVVARPGLAPPEQAHLIPRSLSVYDVVGGINVVVSLGLFWYTRQSGRSQSFLLNLGLGYEVFIALSIGVLDYAGPGPQGLSWIAAIILLFPPIVPSTPGKTLIAALLAASMDPAGALVWKALGKEVFAMPQVFLLSAGNYLCAGVAAVISHIITRLGREVRKAREMGSYVLEDLIGSGGMGEVWQATHRLLVRPAAIKLIKPEVLGAVSPEQAGVLIQRFKREARAAAMLRSPHTIELYDFGVTSDGTFYYVMELLDGLDLQSLVARFGPLPPARVIYLLDQACESLTEAHGRGMVHRDIKPANIHVCRLGEYFDFVKVLDFGLVKVEAPGKISEAGPTAPELISGTPAYLSPESSLGNPIDHRSDIYALGCVAYWMLTGRLVFEGESQLQIIARHIQATPEPPSRFSPVPVPPPLERIVLTCLEKEPERRPASVRDLADRLAGCAVDPRWTREDARRWWQDHLAPAAGAATSGV